MAYKLFIGSLAWATDDASLEAAFAPFGTVVSATVVKDRDSGRSKGFGFVEFADDAEGKAAEAGMNGKELDGREIVVNEARPREERPRRDYDGGGSSNGGGGYRGGSSNNDRGGSRNGGGSSFRKSSW